MPQHTDEVRSSPVVHDLLNEALRLATAQPRDVLHLIDFLWSTAAIDAAPLVCLWPCGLAHNTAWRQPRLLASCYSSTCRSILRGTFLSQCLIMTRQIPESRLCDLLWSIAVLDENAQSIPAAGCQLSLHAFCLMLQLICSSPSWKCCELLLRQRQQRIWPMQHGLHWFA
jgi:hypothetical protein